MLFVVSVNLELRATTEAMVRDGHPKAVMGVRKQEATKTNMPS
jgi:hypothetical protein